MSRRITYSRWRPNLTGHAQPRQRKFATMLASEYALIAAGAVYAGKQTGLLAA